MSFEFTCPHCGKKLEAETDWIGSQGQCPSCNKEITITIDQKQNNIAQEEKESPLSFNEKTNNSIHKSNVLKGNSNSDLKNTSLRIYKLLICGCLILIFILCVLIFQLYHRHSSDDSSNKNQIVEIKQPEVNAIKEVKPKKNIYSIVVNCYLYNDFNEKKVPSCEIRLYQSCLDAEDFFTALHVGKERIAKAQLEYDKWKNETGSSFNIKIDNHIIALLQAQVNTLKELESALAKESIIKEDFFRDGRLNWDDIPNGEYTLAASSTFGKQSFMWVKHIKVKNENVDIDLTNDHSCFMP